MISLVLGGARSGKSEVAERVALRRAHEVRPSRPLTYVATAERGQDAAFDDRIEAHRARRSVEWATVEVGRGMRLSGALTRDGVALVDSVGTWVAGWASFRPDTQDLVDALVRRRRESRPTVLVSDEVGMGVHPPTAAGLEFRDALGEVNRELAEIADEVMLVVAGRVLLLPPDDTHLAVADQSPEAG